MPPSDRPVKLMRVGSTPTGPAGADAETAAIEAGAQDLHGPEVGGVVDPPRAVHGGVVMIDDQASVTRRNLPLPYPLGETHVATISLCPCLSKVKAKGRERFKPART